jgi:hypothetical protein
VLATSVAFIKWPVVEIDAERASVASATRMVGSFLESAVLSLAVEVTVATGGACHWALFVEGFAGGED